MPRPSADPDSFQTTTLFKSYVSKPEITDLAPNYLVRGSKNVLIDYAQRVISRNGYSLFRQANTGGAGFKSSYEWNTSDAQQFPFRCGGGILEFDWNGTFNTLKTGLASSYLKFAKVWDNTEKIDVLLFVLGDTNTYKWSGGVTKLWKSTATTLTKQGVLSAKTTIAFVAGVAGVTAATITDSDANFLNAGFAAGDTINVSGSTSNSRNFVVGSVTSGVLTLVMSEVLVAEAAGSAITIHNGSPTWATSRFLTAGTRKITYNGVDYTYTGGESTDTLTGLTGFPTVAVGDYCWQTLITIANGMAISSNFKQDLIAVQLNQVILASTKSREVYISKDTDYTDFTLTSPRVPGDPAKVTMDDYATCIVPIDNQGQTTSSLAFGAGRNEFFQLSYQLSQDNTNELVRMIKLKTAIGSGLISGSAICPIKNATVYISREPAMDTLSNIEQLNNVPVSDPVKDDFDVYDFTDAHVVYWKRMILVALPAEGVVLIYDLMRKLWQPPQTIPVSRLAVIQDELYGHSAVTNESYKLFDGTNDNGNFIPQVARFAYNNAGVRTRYKNMSEYWTDGYITANGTLTMEQNLGYAGSLGKKVMTILGSDPSIVVPLTGSMLGDEPLGATPIGGATLDAPVSLGTNAQMLRFFQIDTMKTIDYTEQFVEYTMNTLDGQFALVAHGSNQWDAGTVPVANKK